jgi:hypothetical protein
MLFLTAFCTVLFYLMVGHAVADYPLQGEFLARAKNRNTEVGKIHWPYALTAHGLIHGGAVAWVTGSVGLGICETMIHFLTDFWKCEGKLTLKQDQAIHVGCKLFYAALVATYAALTH